MKDNQPSSLSHPAETMIAAYAIGKCSPVEQATIDEHCFTCEKCRIRLSILLRVCASGGSVEERRELERLFPLGIETIAQARQDSEPLNSLHIAKDRQVFSPPSSFPQAQSLNFLDILYGFVYPRRHQLGAIFLAIAVVSGGSYYWYRSKHSPLQNSLNAVNLGYQNNRPLEARVTGIDYQPYERKRGGADDPDVNRDQINYALAELTHTVASNPTAETRHALGKLYLMLHKFDEAERQMNLALEISPKNARLQTDLASLYYERSKTGDPLSFLAKAVEHYDNAIQIDPTLVEAWFNRALCYEQMQQLNKARDAWNKYLEMDKKSPWANEARDHLNKLQNRAARSGDINKATNMALEKAAASNDEAALRQLVTQNFIVAKQFSSGPLFDKYLEAAIKGDEQSAESSLKTITLIGRLASEIKKDEYLKDLAEFAARASPEVKTGMLNVRLMLRQADLDYNRSSLDAAYKTYRSALQAAERLGDQQHAETAAISLFRYSSLRSKSQEIIDLGLQLVKQSENRHHRQSLVKAYLAMANAYFSLQQIGPALDNSLRGLKIARELGDSASITTGLRYTSAAYSRAGDYKQALNKDFELLSSLQDVAPNSLTGVVAYQQIGETLFRLGNYPLAYDYQKESLQIATTINHPLAIAGSAGRIGLSLWKMGKSNEALTYLNDARSRAEQIPDQTVRQLLQIELFTTLGDVSLDQGKLEESIAYYQTAAQSIKSDTNRVYLPSIHQGLAKAYMAQGSIPASEAELLTSIRLAETDRQQILDAGSRSLFLASRQNIYRSMVDLQFHSKQDPTAAFDYTETAKGRGMLDTLSGKASTNFEDGKVTLKISGNTAPLKLKQVQRALPHNEQLLSYFITDKSIMIWVITSDSTFSTSIEYNTNNLQKVIADYISNIRSRRDINLINNQSSELYKILIAPVIANLDRNRLLCIIPDGPLYQLPFDALFSTATGRYLIEDFAITWAPSASVLINTTRLAAKKGKNNSESYLGISNPMFDSKRFSELPSLPSAEDEVSRASALYKQKENFNREKATKGSVVPQIGNYEVVHIASHILIDEHAPLLSSILLAKEPEQATKLNNVAGNIPGGTLQAQEIYQLLFSRTKLVILSGCQSATGGYAQGEALGALAQSFFAAKVPAVIASLWEIDDDASADIMYSFHYNYRMKQMGFGDALSQAQRSMIYSNNTNRRHPYYWAAFLLSGDGHTITSSLN